ncbi:acyltransferase [Luteococcus peritonei]|uniref:Acyltransferase family protein n=1 Tax=Luteococcus peritonei TaxID=88874 RepID=A0ABW4RU98_9ACTN
MASGGKSLFSAFRRVVANGRFIPEIDGLRFGAIGSVVAFHVAVNLATKYPETWAMPDDVVGYTLGTGAFGVQLFFVISGMVLALPFVRHARGVGKPVGLKKYFLRRITRLEPPYVLVMTGLFVMLLLMHDNTPGTLTTHWLASLLYQHNLVFGSESLINNVAWSLEIEIQFYILVPLLTRVFRIQDRRTRLSVIWATIIVFALLTAFVIPEHSRPGMSLLAYLQYFLIGFLLADMHVAGDLSKARSLAWDAVTVIGWPVMIFLIGHIHAAGWGRWCIVAMPFLMLPLFVAAFRGTWTNRLVTLHPIPAIGGMCYSIYLIHNPLLGITLNITDALTPSGPYLLRYLVQLAVNSLIVLFCSGIFYLLVERPCMNPNWYKDLAARLRGRRSVEA